jgi:hypothetical protein
VYLPAENPSSSLVDEHTLEGITSSVNNHTGRRVNSVHGDDVTTEHRNHDVNIRASDNNNTLRMSGKHTWRKAGKRTQKLEMINTPSTVWMSTVLTSAPTRRMISAAARAPLR